MFGTKIGDRLIRFEAMESDLGARATAADLSRVEMTHSPGLAANELRAYFAVAGQSAYLKVFFPHVGLFRVIDEMHRPLEEHGMEEVGHVPQHFAYRVEGGPFWVAQRERFEISLPGSTHYLFVTGGNCLDLISGDSPCFSWVTSDSD
jgi:hypothetical protein